MAVFDQRDSGYWQARVRRKGWPAQSKTFRTKAEAETWARKVEAEIDRGSFVSATQAEGTSFKELARRFRTEFAPQHYRGSSWQNKLDRLVERLGEYALSAITSERVGWYRDARLKDPDPRYKDPKQAPRISGATVKTEVDLLSKVLDVASKEFSITLPRGNPVTAVRKPSDSRARERRLDSVEWHALQQQLKQSRNPWLWPATQLAVETAMRQGELLALRWENIDLEKRTAYLPQTKNGASRTVPLSSAAKAVLESLPRTSDGSVLPTQKQSLYSAFAAACKRAAIYNFTFHDLRHEALSRLAERGDLSVLELSAISGHKTLRLVQLYVQLHASQLAQKLG